MRAFLAAELPPAWRAELLERQAPVPGLRWVRPEQLHLTLAFFAELSDSRAAALSADLDAWTRGREGLRWQLQGSGFFPERGRPRALWVGLRSDGLQALAAGCRTVCSPYLEARELSRPFRPHVTVARCTESARRDDVRRLVEALGAVCSTEESLSQVVLFRSDLSAAGPHYVALKRFPLAAPGTI